MRLLFLSQQDVPLARHLAEQSLASFREQKHRFYSSMPLGLLGLLALENGDLVTARRLLEESRAVPAQCGVRQSCLNHTEAWPLLRHGKERLSGDTDLGAAHALREAIGAPR